jgi:hypothetical protein
MGRAGSVALRPELLEANQLLAGEGPKEVAFELTGHRQELVHLAS